MTKKEYKKLFGEFLYILYKKRGIKIDFDSVVYNDNDTTDIKFTTEYLKDYFMHISCESAVGANEGTLYITICPSYDVTFVQKRLFDDIKIQFIDDNFGYFGMKLLFQLIDNIKKNKYIYFYLGNHEDSFIPSKKYLKMYYKKYHKR